MLLAYENAAKGEGGQGFCRVKRKKRNAHCGMLKIAYAIAAFIDELIMNMAFY